MKAAEKKGFFWSLCFLGLTTAVRSPGCFISAAIRLVELPASKNPAVGWAQWALSGPNLIFGVQKENSSQSPGCRRTGAGAQAVIRPFCVHMYVSLSAVSDSLRPHGLSGVHTPGSSVHGILQARILEWGAISSSRGSSWPRDRTHVSCIFCTAGRFFTTEPNREPDLTWICSQIC